MRSYDDLVADRTHALAVGNNAAQCLASLYNVAANLDENGPETTRKRVEESLRVLRSELRTMERLQREIVAEIEAGIAAAEALADRQATEWDAAQSQDDRK